MKKPIIFILIILSFAVNTAYSSINDSLTITKRIESMRQMYYVTAKDSVYQALAEILQSTREADQWQLSIETMIIWASAANYFGDFATLQRYLDASREIYHANAEKNDNVLLSKILFTKAVLYYQISDLELSNHTFQQCLKIADKQDSTMVTEIYFYLGDNYYDLGNYYLSAQSFDLAMQWVPHDEDYNFYLSQIINRRASMAVSNEHLEKGEQLFRKSLELLINIEEYTPKNAISYGYLTLADVLIRRNKFDEALAALQAINKYLDDKHVIQIRIRKFKGDIYLKRGQLAQAKGSYQQTINLCTQHSNSIRKSEAYYHLADTNWVN